MSENSVRQEVVSSHSRSMGEKGGEGGIALAEKSIKSN